VQQHLRIAFIKAAESADKREIHRKGLCLSDFIASQEDSCDATIVATNILRYFCTDDDAVFNNFMPGVAVFLSFL